MTMTSFVVDQDYNDDPLIHEIESANEALTSINYTTDVGGDQWLCHQ